METLDSAHDVSNGRCEELITVKEASRRLRVSTSTVYRIDRVAGPFRIVQNGRRVLIDSRSLNAYVERQGTKAARNCAPKRQDDSVVPSTVDSDDQSADSPADPAPVRRTGTGQRELVIPERRGPFVVIFMA